MNVEVVLYTSAFCPYCVMAERLLAAKGVVPRKIQVDRDPAARAEMERRTGRRTVPQIFIGTRHVGGYMELAQLERAGELDALLGGAAPAANQSSRGKSHG